MIDAHMHIDIVEPLGWELTVESCIASMDKAGIEKSVVMGITDVPAVNEQALDELSEACSRFPGRLFPLARMHPWYGERAATLLKRALGELDFVGLKLHPVTNLTHPSTDQTLRLMRVASEFGMPTLFHSGDEPLATPYAIAEAARRCPEVKVVLGHMGGYQHVEDALDVAERHDNVFLETSAMPYPERVAEAVRKIGAERVLFGSDGPACPPQLELEKVKRAGLDSAAFRMVTNDNAAGVYAAG